MKKIVLLVLLLFPALALAQIPSGYVQAEATVPILANGYFGAAWTNLSSSPQLGLLGCVSTFQTTVNGTIDSYGKFSVLLADPAQICPSPSTWTFTFSCHTPPGAFIIPITVTGGGSVDDISAQITAAAPTNVCNGGGGGGPAAPAFAVQFANTSAAAFQADPYVQINPTTHTISTPNASLAGTFTNVPTSYTPFAQTIFATGPFVGSADYLNATVSAPLGIGNTSYSQGYGLHNTIGNFLHGGAYATQQANLLSDNYSTQLSRTGGTTQANSYYQVCLGIGDCIVHSGNTYGASGSGNQSGGISIPALQFAQPVLATWPYVFEATLTSVASSSDVFTYTPTQDEGPGAGARTVWDLSRTINTGTATFSLPNVVTFSGATNMQSLNPLGWLLVLGSNSQGYAPSYDGQANGAAGTFASFSNPGQVYAAAVGNSGGSGYVTGNQVEASGCGSGDALFNVVTSGGVVTSVPLAATPTGASGYSVTSNCTTTAISGSGSGLTINITTVTGVIGSAGDSCRVTGFTGGTGATGLGSGGLVLELSGTNTIAGGTPFVGTSSAAIFPGYNNFVNATGGVLSNGVAQCNGNITLNPTSGPCKGDDVIIDGACWGHPQRVSAITSSTTVTVENSYVARLLAANASGTPFVLIPAVPVNDIDIVAHTLQTLGRFYQATSTAGSSITPGVYLLNGTGGLGPGLTCATPPTTPTSGNLQCAQIEVIVGQAGTVSQLIPTVAGGAVYTSSPTFTMTNSTLNIAGGTAGCASTCPIFTAFLDTTPASLFQSGDTVAEPPDHRMSESIMQGIEQLSYLDGAGGYIAKNISNGQNNSAFTIQGNNTYNTGGYEYGITDSAARLNYMFNLNGQPLRSMAQSASTEFNGYIWDWNAATATGGTNYAGTSFTPLAAGAGQPNALPALFLSTKQSLCFGRYGGSCQVGITGQPNTATTFLSSINFSVPVISGLPGTFSLVVTDNVNSSFDISNTSGGLDLHALFSGSTGGTFHVWTAPGSVLTDLALAHTRFSAGIKIGSTPTELTSTDNTGSQVVTIAPSGTINPAELPSQPLAGTTGSIGGGALLVNNCATGTATVTGISSAMAISVTPVSDPNASTTQDYDWYGYMSGTNTVTVKVCALVAGTPAATTYNVRAIQ